MLESGVTLIPSDGIGSITLGYGRKPPFPCEDGSTPSPSTERLGELRGRKVCGGLRCGNLRTPGLSLYQGESMKCSVCKASFQPGESLGHNQDEKVWRSGKYWESHTTFCGSQDCHGCGSQTLCPTCNHREWGVWRSHPGSKRLPPPWSRR
jgi:hypothetical protein